MLRRLPSSWASNLMDPKRVWGNSFPRTLFYFVAEKGEKFMPIVLDHQFREHIPHQAAEFPVTYYQDELAELPNWTGPFHWHPDFEIASAASSVLDYQVGQQHITLEAGDSIFVNGNMLHRVRQVSGDRYPCGYCQCCSYQPHRSRLLLPYLMRISFCKLFQLQIQADLWTYTGSKQYCG